MQVYHLFAYNNLESIKRAGLVANYETNYDHVGSGIYVVLDSKHIMDFAEYIGINDPVLILTLEVDPSQLLMDEDALMVYGPEDINKLAEIMPPEAHRQYMRYLKHNGGDTEAINDPKVATFKTRLIDKYQIRPSAQFMTKWGHYSVLTARCVAQRLMPVDVKVLYGGDVHSVEDYQSTVRENISYMDRLDKIFSRSR